MARPLRIEYCSALYHVTSRGNERKPIFWDNEDRLIFLDLLTKVNEKYNWLCHAYCLMNNHYHIIIETPEGNLSRGMRQLNGVYTQLFNKKYKRVGHIFQGRYNAVLLQKENHLLETYRYVVLNPVRADLVKRPEEWKWSSYRATAGIDYSHPCHTIDWILGQFDTNKIAAAKKFKEFVWAGIGRESIWIKVSGQILLGDNCFIEKFTTYLKCKEDVKEVPRSQRYVNRPSLECLFDTAVLKEKQSRNLTIIEAIMRYGFSQKEVAEYLKMHYSTISRLINEYGKSRIKT
ncbi:MAG: transposase [Nitrospirae bacterium]|nr:transposase [Nitrospirota bacterium]